MATKNMSIEQLIKNLQDIAKNNPNIECLVNDHDWGIGGFNVQVQHVSVNNENTKIIDKNVYIMSLHNIKKYSYSNRSKLWNEIQEEEMGIVDGFYDTYEEFLESCNYKLAEAESNIKQYENSKEYLIIQRS